MRNKIGLPGKQTSARELLRECRTMISRASVFDVVDIELWRNLRAREKELTALVKKEEKK